MTKTDIENAVARALQEFGYPDATPTVVRDVLTAYLLGKRGSELPHGVVGLFAESHIKEIEEARPGIFSALEKGEGK